VLAAGRLAVVSFHSLKTASSSAPHQPLGARAAAPAIRPRRPREPTFRVAGKQPGMPDLKESPIRGRVPRACGQRNAHHCWKDLS
jgi:hypothetical protein